MDIAKNEHRILFKEFRSDRTPWFCKAYGIKCFPENSIKTILDIGANIGFYSICFRFLHPKTRIVSVEPDETTYRRLVNNASRLDISCYRLALGDNKFVSKTQGRNTLCNKFINGIDKRQKGAKSRAMMLPEIIKTFNINAEDGFFIKLDCEGGESCIINHKESENILKKAIGFSFEFHNDILNIPINEGEKWFNDTFGETHDIFIFTGRCMHVTAFRKDVKVKETNNIV